MPTVNITPKAKQIAADAGLFIEAGYDTRERPDGKPTGYSTVEIGEDCSDFLIVYGQSADGSLFLICKPAYVEDLPAHIDNSLQLRRVVEFAALEVTR